MKKLSILLLAALSLALPSPASAADTAGNAIFIPIVSRTPGALGTAWRTDLVISNVSRIPTPVPFTITFHPNDGSPAEIMTGEIPGRTSFTYPDVVAIGFGESVAAGNITVTSSSASARLTARARIYNIASESGEFGQHVPGVRVADLTREHHLAGLTGVAGNRTNLGIANPWNEKNDFWINVFDAEGQMRFAAGWWTLEPHQVIQINDVFAWMGIDPIPSATFELKTGRPAYVYASIVRNDSGDPIFVQAVNPGSELVGGVIEPDCTAPAPLYLATNPAEGWIVMFQDDTIAGASAAILAQKYGFTVKSVYEDAFKGFTSTDLTHGSIAKLRCEPAVKLIQQNEYVPLPGH